MSTFQIVPHCRGINTVPSQRSVHGNRTRTAGVARIIMIKVNIYDAQHCPFPTEFAGHER